MLYYSGFTRRIGGTPYLSSSYHCNFNPFFCFKPILILQNFYFISLSSSFVFVFYLTLFQMLTMDQPSRIFFPQSEHAASQFSQQLSLCIGRPYLRVQTKSLMGQDIRLLTQSISSIPPD